MQIQAVSHRDGTTGILTHRHTQIHAVNHRDGTTGILTHRHTQIHAVSHRDGTTGILTHRHTQIYAVSHREGTTGILTHSVTQRWHLRHTETRTRPNFSHNSFLLHNVLLLPAQKLSFSQILPTVDSSSLRTNSTPSLPRRRSNSDHPGKSTYSGEIDYRFLTFQTGSRF